MFCICPHTTIWYFLQSLALTLTLIMVRSHHVARIFHPFLIYWHNIFATYLDKKCLHASQWSSVKCFFFSVMISKAARPPWTNLGRRVWQLDPVGVNVFPCFSKWMQIAHHGKCCAKEVFFFCNLTQRCLGGGKPADSRASSWGSCRWPSQEIGP